MSQRKVPLIDGEYYHIYNRGNSKQKIFLDEDDYEHFVKCLFVSNTYRNFKFRDHIVDINIDAFDFDRGDTLVSVGAWVLMPNHFHLYLIPAETPSHMSDMWEKGMRNKIGEFMRKLSTAYAKYFNAKYARTGSLFEGVFKSMHIKNDIHAKYLFAYIHLNPVKILEPKWKDVGIRDIFAAEEYLQNYEWSSYLDHLGIKRVQNAILLIEDFPKFLKNSKAVKKDIFGWLRYKEL